MPEAAAEPDFVAEPCLIAEIDGVAFHGRFAGFSEDLVIEFGDGQAVTVPPWRLGEHLAALRDSLFSDGTGLTVDAMHFAGRVLSRSDGMPEMLERLAPVLLWWAAGGDEARPAANPLGLAAGTVSLRPWSEAQRIAACRDALHDGPALDAVSYLTAMVDATATATDPAVDLRMLDSSDTARLLDGVTRCNVHDPATDPLFAAGTAAAVRDVLPLCRALGWTPAQVLDTPAVEVDRLRRLLDVAPAAAPRPTGLAAAPDATTFLFSDP